MDLVASVPTREPQRARQARRAAMGVEQMRTLGVAAGDVVRLSRGASSTYATAWPSFAGADGEVQVAPAALLNCGARVGDALRVERAGALPVAERVDVALAGASSEPAVSEAAAAEALAGAGCVRPGQIVDVGVGGTARRLRVQRVVVGGRELGSEDGAAVARGRTRVAVAPAPGLHRGAGGAGATSSIGDIGGLDAEVREIQRIVDGALHSSQAFAAAGLQAPRGVLLCGPPGTGKTLVARAVAAASGASVHVVSGAEAAGKWVGEAEARLRAVFAAAAAAAPSVVFIDEVDALCPRRSGAGGGAAARVVATLLALLDGVGDRGRVVVLAATNRPDALDAALRRPGRFDREIDVPVPSPAARLQILHARLARTPHALDGAQLAAVAAATHGFVGADLAALVREAAVVAIKQAPAALPVASLRITHAHVQAALRLVAPSCMREAALEIPSVRWADIGGQHATRQLLRESVEWPLRHPDAFRRMGVRPPRGVLLYGPPGCSKTLTAKALATEAGLNFIAVRGPELFSKWVGESEKAVRAVFRKARAAAPAIVFFDEIDALTVKRGASGSASVADRVLAQLLAELDGIEPLVNVTVVAATNRPDVIDPAILRPDRIDRLVYVGPPDQPARREILAIALRKTACAPDVDSEALAARTDGFSGAEVVALCQDAAIGAMAEDADAACVAMRHFDACLLSFKKRITPEMLQFYADFQNRS